MRAVGGWQKALTDVRVEPDQRGPPELTKEQRREKWSDLYTIIDRAITAAQSKGDIFCVHKLAYQLKALDPCHDYTYDQLLYHLRSMGFQYGRVYRNVKTGRSKDYVLEHLWEYCGRRVERHAKKDPNHVDIFLDECWLWQAPGIIGFAWYGGDWCCMGRCMGPPVRMQPPLAALGCRRKLHLAPQRRCQLVPGPRRGRPARRESTRGW